VFACKVSFDFKWHGPKDSALNGEVEGGKSQDIGPLIGNPNYNEWLTANYEITQNKYGYCAFEKPLNFEKLKAQLEALPEVKEKGIKISQFNSGFKKQNKNKDVFFKQFPDTWTEDNLKAKVIAASGVSVNDIVSVYINRDPNGVSKKNGIVSLKTREDAVKVISALNGMKIEGQAEKLYANELIHNDQRRKAQAKALQK
jgi:RNA recognition motif-containing protein